MTDSDLFGQGTISENALGIFFEPYISPPLETTGQITFGGTDPTKFNGNIEYAPTVNTGPARKFWGVKMRITYGNRVVLRSTAGVINCATTLILIATGYQRKTTIVRLNFSLLPKINTVTWTFILARYVNSVSPHTPCFTILHIKRITPNAQIWPRSLNSKINGMEGSIYLVVGDTGTFSGINDNDGLSLGYVFLQRFYVAYDATNARVELFAQCTVILNGNSITVADAFPRHSEWVGKGG
ncbi:hypothetical protein BDR07DRAFT_1614103 [Suillus spraguei]|nr:hypothetical protein BDR07DRAFT_1614103 [Suillus spraguei]